MCCIVLLALMPFSHAGWPSMLAVDCSAACNLLCKLLPSANQADANCVFLEIEDPSTQRPHILAFNFTPVDSQSALILLDADPSCAQADMTYSPLHSPGLQQASHLDQLLQAQMALQHQGPPHQVHTSRDPRLNQSAGPPSPVLQEDPQPTPAPQLHPPVPKPGAAAEALHCAPSQTPARATPPTNGSSATDAYRAHIPCQAAADTSVVTNLLAAAGEDLVEEATCVRLYEGLIQAKLRAALKRSTEEAVEKGDAGCNELEAASKLLEQRRQDIVRLKCYSQGLKAVLDQLS